MSRSIFIRGAVLDLGSNTFKLMLVEQRGDVLRVVRETALTTRLGENLVKTKKISPTAIRRSLAVLKKCRKEIQKFGACHVVAVGTSALRSAKNRKAFLVPAEKILGIQVHIISGKKEAELVYLGITSNPKWKEEEILNIDVGGGSVELIHGKRGKILGCRSFPIGCVRLKDLFLSKYPLKKSSLEDARDFLVKKIGKNLRAYRKFKGKLLSSGGTMNALCAMKKGKLEEGFKLTRPALRKMIGMLSAFSLGKLKKIRHLPPDRADIIVPGALILLMMMEMLGQNEICCATKGLRYGIWRNFLLLKFAKKA